VFLKREKDANGMKLFVLHVLFLLIGNWAGAQILINYRDTPPDIDADARDWNSPLYTFKQKAQFVKSPNEVRYAFGFDETNLYGIFKVKDKHLTDLAQDKSGSPRIMYNDAIEFYIDTQNNSSVFMNDDDFQLIMDCTGHLTVFRGGDKFLMKVERSRVPKDTVTAHFVMDYKAKLRGSVNDNSDVDEGYMIEFQVAWAALGVRPKPNECFKIDVCLNDADEFVDIRPLSDEAAIPFYAFQSMEGNNDFGFPNKWPKAILHGQASVWKKIWLALGNAVWGLLGFFLVEASWMIVRLQRSKPLVIREKVVQVVGQKEVNVNKIFVSKATLFVSENLQKDLLPSDLAAYFNVSLRQLQRQFREEADTTPTDLIRKIKLEKAAQLLMTSSKNIAEIAYELGFSDPTYFSRLFKKHFGQTPSKFQDNARAT
jgi:AraC-like DNA-binding protein